MAAFAGGKISAELDWQLNDACLQHQFRRVVQDGRAAVERTYRIRYNGHEEVVRAIIQPDANRDGPPRIWCPGAASGDVAANSELYDLPYRRDWKPMQSTLAGLAEAITRALCSKDLVTRAPNPRFNMQRGTSYDSSYGGVSSGSSVYDSAYGATPGPTLPGSIHTAPVAYVQPHGGVDPPVVNRSRTSVFDNKGAPVMYPDSRNRRQFSQSSVDIPGSSGWHVHHPYDQGRDLSSIASNLSSVVAPPPGYSMSDRDAGYPSIYPSTAPAHSGVSVGAGAAPERHSGPLDYSGPQRHPGSRGSSGHHSSGGQGHISTENVRIGGVEQYGPASYSDMAISLHRQLEEEKRRHSIIQDSTDGKLAVANERIRRLEFELSSHGLSRKDLERRDSEICSLHEQVQLMTQSNDQAQLTMGDLRQDLQRSQDRDMARKEELQLLSTKCTQFQVERDELRSRNSNVASGGETAESRHTTELKIKSLLAQLEQAKLRASEFERHAKSVELEKENQRKELEVQKSMVISLTEQVKALEWEYGKVPTSNGGDNSDGSMALASMDTMMTASFSQSLMLEDVSVPSGERERAQYYQRLALTAHKDRQEVFVLFASKIADFDVVKKVAHGCEGAVYLVRCKKARFPDPSKLFALKVMFNIFRMESLTQVRREYQNEYEILAQLPPHPNVVRLCAFFFDRMGNSLPDLPPEVRERARSMSLFLVMDYAPNNLKAVCLEERVMNRISIMMLINWAYQLAESLYFLAAHNVVHRDMKLDNVLVALNGTIKVCDFGFAIRLDNSNMKLKMFPNMPMGGNPAHLAPEVLNANHTDNDGFCDYSKQPVWELGVMVFEMLHGVSPFHKLEQHGYSMASVPRLDTSRLHVVPGISKDAQVMLAQDLQKLALSLVEFDLGRRPSTAEMHSALMSLNERAKLLAPRPAVTDLPLGDERQTFRSAPATSGGRRTTPPRPSGYDGAQPQGPGVGLRRSPAGQLDGAWPTAGASPGLQHHPPPSVTPSGHTPRSPYRLEFS